MEYFVDKKSIVREIWGNSDTILFIFAGAAAEFALNKAVDWLYFTGRLPADPIGRLFSTVRYAREIVFFEKEKALQSIDKITQIHQAVEKSRGTVIPDWAYRDVLFMLIHYSIAAYELLQRNLSPDEKEEVYQVFYRMGLRMELKELPPHYTNWLSVRQQHLNDHLQKTKFTTDLFAQYKKHLGNFRYLVLRQAQLLVLPQKVKQLLGYPSIPFLAPAVPVYKLSRRLHLDGAIRALLLPAQYKKEINELNVVSA